MEGNFWRLACAVAALILAVLPKMSDDAYRWSSLVVTIAVL